jgi:hypothetical protein
LPYINGPTVLLQITLYFPYLKATNSATSHLTSTQGKKKTYVTFDLPAPSDLGGFDAHVDRS